MSSKNKQNEQSTALTVQSEIPDFIGTLLKEIEGLKRIQESVYVTSGKITMVGGQKDIKSETSVTELVKAFAGVQSRAKAMEEAYAELGITTYDVVKVDGSTVEEWKKDILLRIDIINQKDRLDELNALKKEAEELMDKEDRKKLFFQKVQKTLGA